LAAFRFVAAGVSVQLNTLGITTALSLGLHLTEVKFARDDVLGGVVFTALVLPAVSSVLTWFSGTGCAPCSAWTGDGEDERTMLTGAGLQLVLGSP
jgi:hypothetical protein